MPTSWFHRWPCIVLLMAVWLCAAAPASAAIYRWVDASGQPHYTQTPPPPGMAYRRIESAAPAPAPPAPDAGLQSWLKARESARRQAAERAQAKRREAAARAQRCDAARERLARLQARPPYRLMVRDQSGTPTRMSPEEYRRRQQAAEQAVAEHCGPGTGG